MACGILPVMCAAQASQTAESKMIRPRAAHRSAGFVASVATFLLCPLVLSAGARLEAQATPAGNPVASASDTVIVSSARARLDAPQAPLSAVALLGRKIFFDARLSASGKMSCATCHNPQRAYAPANALAVQLGGPDMKQPGIRAVPSLTYLEHTPSFSIGPDQKPDDDDDHAAIAAALAQQTAKLDAGVKVASVVKADIATGGASAAAEEMVPQGGLDWDGRAASLLEQAGGPLLDPREMANPNAGALLAKLKTAPYAKDMTMLFGPGVFTTPSLALGEAYFALARYQVEDRSFHSYDSKFDYYLAGRVSLSARELRGKQLFDDPKKGNCAACHLDKPSKDGRAPVFTDYQFEALGAPRNRTIAANRNARFYDEGLCGPLRKDLARQQNYCGLFKTPSLRNVATRQVFFHNGVFRSLEQVMHFYIERETKPQKWYPRAADGKVHLYNDLPPGHRGNVDVTDAPFDRKPGDGPALSDDEIRAVIAFLETLTDGYHDAAPAGGKRNGP
jgi:cytochrome c peroxidase